MRNTLQALSRAAVVAVGVAGIAHGASPASLTSIQARIETLKAPDVAWRQIPWKSCLLDGLREARRTGKPLMLWIFIDRPAGDQRC